ncbi:Chromosome (plasmid) partitioning protein ParA [hydrothermal vent metagenome]|uniref:Chromosome (Plasmid) partitioning protein ParA n=1 Tax=hydrothermal vent metagenome TaxID=652676 RepID=A0A3B0XKQ4_9ZZZZ
MKRIIVINAKGGCGKTTVSTSLASYYATQGVNTALFDYDPQGSSMRWLKLRSAEQAEIYGVVAHKNAARSVTMSWQLRLPTETQRLIIDTPPGLKGPDLREQLKGVDKILIPVLPSPLDIFATADFIRDLLLDVKVRLNDTSIGIVANRVKKNTVAFQSLERFLNSLNIPVVAQLRDTQNYLRATEEGMGIHELKGKNVYVDKMHWKSIAQWLDED